ncbi:MAG: 4Fe-4S binding protein [Candidatus Omnitrophica bacterium]|nr:4Fe-4S binding protein [Candidatus Omnitrophota bacterium]
MKRPFGTSGFYWILSYAALAMASTYYEPQSTIALTIIHAGLTVSLVILTRVIAPGPAAILDIGNMAALIWIFYHDAGRGFPVILFTPLITALVIIRAHKERVNRRIYVWPVLPVLWAFAAFKLSGCAYSTGLTCSFSASFIMLFVFLAVRLRAKYPAIRSIDVVLSSYSGNTEHFTDIFIQEAREKGVNVRVHRFHKHKRFKADLTQESLVVAFPVMGWKPPWPFLTYLVLKLPRGHGKPAFILYTSAGGPENAGALTWLILALKGYRLMGLNWGMYPLNMAMFRLGPKRIWDRLDSLLPDTRVLPSQKECARAFIEGSPSGAPVILSPTPLFIIGALIDNFLVDTVLCHNHIYRDRCVKCGLCARYCPAERLRTKNGYPYSRGECALCFGCVNICPNGAMHLWWLSEYGNKYRPRWYDKMIARAES